MKKAITVTVVYLPSLGSYLDNNNIDYYNNDNGTITFKMKNVSDVFLLGVMYQKWFTKIDRIYN